MAKIGFELLRQRFDEQRSARDLHGTELIGIARAKQDREQQRHGEAQMRSVKAPIRSAKQRNGKA